MRLSIIAVGIAMLSPMALIAQQAEQGSVDSLIQEAKAAYSQEKTSILAAADNMPEADYSFKPTPEIRPYGELLMHITQTQNSVCAIIAGNAPQTRGMRPAGQPAQDPPKAQIIAQLKASFDACDAAIASVTPANALDIVGRGYFHGTRVGLIEKNTTHDNEMYGTIAVYLRLKGIVPPTTAARSKRP